MDLQSAVCILAAAAVLAAFGAIAAAYKIFALCQLSIKATNDTNQLSTANALLANRLLETMERNNVTKQ
jgi:hypothetical protein